MVNILRPKEESPSSDFSAGDAIKGVLGLVLLLALLALLVLLIINWKAVLCVLFYAVFGFWLFCTVCEKLGIGKNWFN